MGLSDRDGSHVGLMVASIFFGLFVAALILLAIETAQQCAEE